MTKRKTRNQITKSKTKYSPSYNDEVEHVYTPPKFIPAPTPNPENELLNKNFIEVIGAVRTYADLFKDKKLINHVVHESGSIEPKVGDFVKFKGFVEKAKFNGKIGLVKKELGDSRFQVATMNDANDFSVSVTNIDVMKNCNSEYNRMEIGEMIWPKIKGVSTPSSHWVKDRLLTAMTMNFFDALDFYEFDESYEKFGYAGGFKL